MADSKFNNSYYTRPSTAPNYGAAIGGALQNFLAQRQEAQKMALLQQEMGWKNPERTIGPNEQERAIMENYQKGLAARMAYGDPLNFNQFRSQVMGGGMPQGGGQPPSQGQDNQAKIMALIEELYQARKAKGDSNATV